MRREYADYVVAQGGDHKTKLFILPAWTSLKKDDLIIAENDEMFTAIADTLDERVSGNRVHVLEQLFGEPVRAKGYMHFIELDYSEYDEEEEEAGEDA